MGSSMSRSVLFICTSADKYPTAPEAGSTGCWAEEVAAPFLRFKEKGYVITIASIKGGEVPMDAASLNPPFLTEDVEKYLQTEEAMTKIANSLKLEDVNAASYDAVFLPGGHGTCIDFPTSEELAKQLSAAYAAGKVVSAVCHGVNGLVNVKAPDGSPIVKGKKITGFSNAEEKALGKESVVSFLLEDRLKELGGEYVKAGDWEPFAVRDGILITGQNPQSGARIAELIIEALDERVPVSPPRGGQTHPSSEAGL